MPSPRKTQKEIARRYLSNLRYSRVYRLFGRMRMILSLLVLILATVFATQYIKLSQNNPKMEQWNSPGPISQAHSGVYKESDGMTIAVDCKKCHDPNVKINPLNQAAITASLNKSCESCHANHAFHEESIVEVSGASCIDCHHEHQGSGPMKAVANTTCAVCHNDKGVLDRSQQKSLALGNPPEAFDMKVSNPQDAVLIKAGNPPAPFAIRVSNVVYFQPPSKSKAIYTPFSAFDNGHPDFQIQQEHLVDQDSLKYGHKFHLHMPDPRDSKKELGCDYCHQSDVNGMYMQQLSFEKNCQACHAIKVDPTLPGLQIPHPNSGGSITSVRDFILTLPTQYAYYLNQHPGEMKTTAPVQPALVAKFVNQHLSAVGWPGLTANQLVNNIYYADRKYVYTNGVATGRAQFPGCLECHEVKAGADSQPVVTRAVIPDRWFAGANFSHAAHNHMTCLACHSQAEQSSKTSDILLPDKASCVACHSTKGNVVSTCITCHDYHNTPMSKSLKPDMAFTSLRSMMLAKHD